MSRLKARPPEAIRKRLKALLFGPAGAGKTTLALQFPRPYYIDTERGAENEEYVNRLTEAGGVYLSTCDPWEIVEELRALIEEKHDYQTLVIDPITTVWDALLDHYAAEVGTEFSRHKGPAKRIFKQIVRLIYRLDMNVVLISHAKPNWVRTTDAKGKDSVAQEGMTFDGPDGSDYIMDLVFEFQRRGKGRVVKVVKTRMGSAFPEGETFPADYAEFASRYGSDVLEAKAKPQELATADQVKELEYLAGKLKVPESTIEKWWAKADASAWEEMPREAAAKCIEHMKAKEVA